LTTYGANDQDADTTDIPLATTNVRFSDPKTASLFPVRRDHDVATLSAPIRVSMGFYNLFKRIGAINDRSKSSGSRNISDAEYDFSGF